MILDRGWAEANGAEVPARDEEKFTTRNTNGTGPFMLTARDPGVDPAGAQPRLVGRRRAQPHRGDLQPDRDPATGLAALLSGEIDMLAPIPVRDVARLRETDGIQTFEGLETRVIMLGFGHDQTSLRFSTDLEGENPFRDVRVRRAVAHAIDVGAIDQVLMSGMAEPASQLLPAGLSGYSQATTRAPPHDRGRRARAAGRGGLPATAFPSACAAPTTAI
jgi:peptide/nickel transport system substrate-binding protein